MPNVRTPIGVLSFPHLFTPRPRAQGSAAVYQINLLFDKAAQGTPEFAALKRAVMDAIVGEWGAAKASDRAFVQRLRLPFRPCQEKDYKGYDIPGGVYINPWSNTRPGVVDADRNEIVTKEDLWPGQMARATVNAFAYANSGNLGVSFGLNNLQICRTDTPRLDDRRSAQEDFPAYQRDPALQDADDDEVPFWLGFGWRADDARARNNRVRL
jgi:hypothetical protein